MPAAVCTGARGARRCTASRAHSGQAGAGRAAVDGADAQAPGGQQDGDRYKLLCLHPGQPGARRAAVDGANAQAPGVQQDGDKHAGAQRVGGSAGQAPALGRPLIHGQKGRERHKEVDRVKQRAERIHAPAVLRAHAAALPVSSVSAQGVLEMLS